MAETVSVRALRQHLAAYLERANGGEVITITRAGRVDAQLVAPGVESAVSDEGSSGGE
jgi:prevent-host-death family protein